MTIARKYTLTRIRAGDYLLLSNDGTVLWRLSTYDEDGSAQKPAAGGKGWVSIRGRFWGLWKYRHHPDSRYRQTPITWHDWSEFEMTDSMFKTREQAIEQAMKDDERRMKG